MSNGVLQRRFIKLEIAQIHLKLLLGDVLLHLRWGMLAVVDRRFVRAGLLPFPCELRTQLAVAVEFLDVEEFDCLFPLLFLLCFLGHALKFLLASFFLFNLLIEAPLSINRGWHKRRVFQIQAVSHVLLKIAQHLVLAFVQPIDRLLEFLPLKDICIGPILFFLLQMHLDRIYSHLVFLDLLSLSAIRLL